MQPMMFGAMGMPPMFPMGFQSFPTAARTMRFPGETGNPLLGAGSPLLSSGGRGSSRVSVEDTGAKDRDVRRLGSFFKIEEEWVKRLDEVMERRQSTKARDLAKLYEVLDNARNPSSFLVVLIDKMESGLFTTSFKADENIERLVERFKLDDDARWRLVELRVRRPDTREEDYEQLQRHLQHCQDPSFTAVSLIKKVVQGRLDDMPDMSQATALMEQFQLNAEARCQLRDIVEKRAEDLEKALRSIVQVLQISFTPSAHLLQVADVFMEGGMVSDEVLKQIAREARKAKKKAEKRAKKHAKSSSESDSSESDSDSSDSEESKAKKKKKKAGKKKCAKAKQKKKAKKDKKKLKKVKGKKLKKSSSSS